ncbi:hypothetical protein IEO70_10765 [Bacillus sp. AGMB 02131]|uniref:Uncharacterized protein n=1 Tax=Peribacillus faecalis TaxID=2772559 RepID=A0A927HBT3_9BACI|nr:hypothetical protein [Peribacillus faecalis]MBD3108846.1 hypothetical protein [Peribacillus faecalis]
MKAAFVPTGRDLGFYVEENGMKYYAAGSSLNFIILSQLEYYAWKKLRSYKSVLEWRDDMQKKLELKFKAFDMDMVLLKLMDSNLIMHWEFDDPEDIVLQSTYAVRNGVPYGLENGKWRFGGPLEKDKVVLTREQYTLWNAAAGNATLIEILAQAMTELNITDDQVALKLLTEEGRRLVRVGLWNIEPLTSIGGTQHAE